MSANTQSNGIDRLRLLREAARKLAASGAVVVRLEPKKKKPIGKEWGHLRPKPEDFRERENIGIKVGASSSLVDIDCDWEESRFLAPRFLPPTGMTHGRPESRRSHHWYSSAGDTPHEQFKDPTVKASDAGKAMIIEFRGGTDTDQRQTMVPPSIHPDTGETLEWDQHGEAARVDAADLLRVTKALASASLLAKHWPGARHEASLALCGALARAGWAEEEIAAFVAAIAAWVNRAEPSISDGQPDKRKAQARDSIAALKANEQVTGIPTLIDLGVPEKVIGKVREWLELPAAAMNGASKVEVADGDNFVSHLLAKKDGTPVKCGSNIEAFLRFHPELKGRIRFNSITRTIEIAGGVFSEERPNTLDVAVKNWLERQGLIMDVGSVGQQLLRVAIRYGSYDPVREYLTALTWDRKPRIERWLIDYCKVKDEQYVRHIGLRFFVSAAARGLDPGCKVDTVLILKGAQGVLKSSTFSVLGGEYFSDSPLDLGNKDARIEASARWIIELAELAALGQAGLERNKAFLSASKDFVRPPYGRASETFARHCVFVGTTNAKEFLIDDTGNRRYWVAEVGDRIDLDGLRRDRNQLWAEAVHRYRADERWWFNADEQIEADKIAAAYLEENPWADKIAEWYWGLNEQKRSKIGVSGVSLGDVGELALAIKPADLDRHKRHLGKALRHAGWTQRDVGKARLSRWFPGSGQ